MSRRLIIISLFLLISVSFSGCLLVDNSTSLTMEDKEEIKINARELTNNFFQYNQYDSTKSNSEYKVEKLINLFKEKRSGKVVTIDPIIGPKYDKGYAKLEKELQAQESLFEDQEKYNYKLLFKNKKGNKSYKIFLNEGQYTSNTATYDVLFQVFEEVNGNRFLTDNGVITFELEYEGNNKWLINHLIIDYRDLGAIKLNDN